MLKGYMLEEYEEGNVINFETMEELIEYLVVVAKQKRMNPENFVSRVLANDYKFLGFQIDWLKEATE